MMRVAMRADRLPVCLTVVILLAGLSSVALPQEATAPETPAAAEAPGNANPADEKPPAERTVDELTDAERLLRMQQVVTADEAKLERLRTDLESRQAFLDQLKKG